MLYCYCVCVHDVCICMCAMGEYVVRGQLCGVRSIFSPYVVPGIERRLLGLQVPLSFDASCQL